MENINLNECQKTAFKALIAVLVLFFCILSLFFLVFALNKLKEAKYIGYDKVANRTITVSDSAEIYAKPDLGRVTFSVVSEADTVAQAMEDNTQKINQVIAAAKSSGVEEKDLKTTSFNIYPRYEWTREELCEGGYCPEGKRVLAGYEISQSLEVKIRNLDATGEIIEKATQAGANQVGSLSFTIDDPDELRKQVRGQAIEKAKIKAQELAGQLGVRLEKIVNFNENGSQPDYRISYSKTMAADMEEEAVSVPEIQTGENLIKATVSITYEIQ